MSAPAEPCNARLTLDDLVRQLAATEDEAARRRLLLDHLDGFDHDTLFTRLKDEAERYRMRDVPSSLRLAEGLIFAAGQVGHARHRAMGLLARGDAIRTLGRFAEAAALLNEAGDILLELGDEVGWARTRLGWLLVAYELGQGEQALSNVSRAREVLVRAGMWLRVGILDLNTGDLYRNLGRYHEALATYGRAREAFSALGASATEQLAWVDVNTANVLPFIGEYQTALQLHEEVQRLWTERGETVRGAWQEHNIAVVLAGMGFYTRALQHYLAAAATLERVGLPFDAAWNDLRATECYLRLNMLPQAIALAEATRSKFEQFGAPPEIARASLIGAVILRRSGDHGQARRLLDQAIATFRATSHADELALSLLELASVSLVERGWEAALATAAQAREIFGAHHLIVRQAQAELVWARAALGMGDRASAAAGARAALAIAATHGIPWLRPDGHALLGEIAHASGEPAQALDEYERAIGCIEELQRALAVDLRDNFLADKRQIYTNAIKVSLQLQQRERAFAYLERAKSRALVDYLASNLDIQIQSRGQRDQEYLDRLARLRAEHHWLYNQLYAVTLARSGQGRAQADEDRLQATIRDREAQIARMLEQLALERTEGLEVVPTLGARQDALPTARRPGQVVLEYVLRDDFAAVFVGVAGRLVVVPLSVSAQGVQRLLKAWQLHLAATIQVTSMGTPVDGLESKARAILGALYRALILPVEAHLAGCTRLIVIPDGPLHGVPFHALHSGEHYLVERCEVTACPASSLLRLCEERARRPATVNDFPTALIVAHSDGGRLPYVLDEARAVGALLPGEVFLEERATREVLQRAAARHTLVHIAAHGEARLDNPAFAHLRLADGQLSTIDVFNLRLRGATVVLSGCETGRSVVTDGEELIGLSRGFLYAGAATLVQSLWRVDDGSTADLMVRFYEGLRNDLTKAAALRRAQRALLRQHPHPYFWAPFQILGDCGPLITQPSVAGIVSK